jgi:DNA-binding response OmpR family regulator
MGIKKKIFIVDDDSIIHETITAVLSSDEFEIIHFLTVKTSWNELKTNNQI